MNAARGLGAIALGTALSCLAGAPLAFARDVERTETVGVVPLRDDRPAGGLPRDQAIRRALTEAVRRVASSLLPAGTAESSGSALEESLGDDPFEFTTAELMPGHARYFGAEAAAVVRRTGTEVAVSFGRMRSGEATDYSILGLTLRQGLSMPSQALGTWRLLLDYEQVDGGRPFELAQAGTDDRTETTRVGRVSGGVSVQF